MGHICGAPFFGDECLSAQLFPLIQCIFLHDYCKDFCFRAKWMSKQNVRRKSTKQGVDYFCFASKIDHDDRAHPLDCSGLTSDHTQRKLRMTNKAWSRAGRSWWCVEHRVFLSSIEFANTMLVWVVSKQFFSDCSCLTAPLNIDKTLWFWCIINAELCWSRLATNLRLFFRSLICLANGVN